MKNNQNRCQISIALTSELIKCQPNIIELLADFQQVCLPSIGLEYTLLHHSDYVPITDVIANTTLSFTKVFSASWQQLADVASQSNFDLILSSQVELFSLLQGLNLACVVLKNVESRTSKVESQMSDDKRRRSNVETKLKENTNGADRQLHFTFDGDGVLFNHGIQLDDSVDSIEAFEQFETNNADKPMNQAVLFNFISKVDTVAKQCPQVSWSLVTARGPNALPRAVNTLSHWQLNPAGVYFLSGQDKTPILRGLNSSLFFDDHPSHCERARPYINVGQVLI
ncbi:5'-nucleotidase [Paraferrimonas sp. SM1919]|uniref:5'-nucleotidase n=1 Tax=Paraferrimonas sp. SM1919 TaxID=2662263 RepID=UPI0013D78517|nr:5'-nucleotidase [Paraferrimonas sp. SM1919]